VAKIRFEFPDHHPFVHGFNKDAVLFLLISELLYCPKAILSALFNWPG
jgi:hypothetical protein